VQELDGVAVAQRCWVRLTKLVHHRSQLLQHATIVHLFPSGYKVETLLPEGFLAYQRARRSESPPRATPRPIVTAWRRFDTELHPSLCAADVAA